MLPRLFFTFRYLFRPPWDTGESPPELLALLESRPVGTAVDLGCGTGTNAITMATRDWKVTGVDFAPNAIIAARRKSRRLGLEIDFQIGDVSRWQPELPVDLVLDIGCLHNLDLNKRARYIDQLPDLLRPGGTFLLYANIQTSQPDARPGLTDQDLQRLSRFMALLRREDGTNRGSQPSAWLTYRLEREELA